MPSEPLSTPDGRYIVVRGRLWRRADPSLSKFDRQALVDALMTARRNVRDALRHADPDALRAARASVDAAKHGLGERGPVWWTDGAPDLNRRLAKNTPYAAWWRAHEQEPTSMAPGIEIQRLRWIDEVLGEIALPKAVLRMTLGLGSGLARRVGDPEGTIWAIGDRGPNMKVKVAIKRYGVEGLEHLKTVDGAKIMPCLDHGPALVELRVDQGSVTRVRTLPIRNDAGPLSGLPVPCGADDEAEPIHALDGTPLGTDPSGLDSEGVAAFTGGGFWVGDEYGPSLLRLDADGRVLVRWVPAATPGSVDGASFEGAGYPVEPVLPALASARRLNRGFEAVALSEDERWLILAFQSPLSHPNRAAHETSRHIRVWQLDAVTGAFHAEYIYPLAPPSAFLRDVALGEFEQSDVKVSELIVLPRDRLLVLERGSASTKFYTVTLSPACATPARFLDPDTRPTIEQMDPAALREAGVMPLAKTLILDTDEIPDLPADLEGAAMLSPLELLLVNDNDFGVEGVETQFWRVTLADALF